MSDKKLIKNQITVLMHMLMHLDIHLLGKMTIA